MPAAKEQVDVKVNVDKPQKKEADVNITKPVEIKKNPEVKNWPSDRGSLLSYEALVNPLKKILNSGYKIMRLIQVKEFEYDGFNLGEEELKIFSPPHKLFTEKYIENEKANQNNVIDIVLNMVFCLGMEQGRRSEYRKNLTAIDLLSKLNKSNDENKDFKKRIDELESIIEVMMNDSEDISDLLVKKRKKRIQNLKNLTNNLIYSFLDKNRFSFNMVNRILRIKLQDETYTKQQWREFLGSSGWKFEDWDDECKKRLLKFKFLNSTN
jgi:hypothetical protein